MNKSIDTAMASANDHAREWKVLESHAALDSKWFKVSQDTVQLPDGSILDDYFVWERGDAAVVVPMTTDGHFVVTRQYKYGSNGIVMEFPGGGVEPGETPEAAAHREVIEETGYAISDIRLMTVLINDPTKERGKIFIYLAGNSTKVQAPSPEPTESVETVVVTPGELRDLITTGRMCTSSSVSAAFIALDMQHTKGYLS